MNFINSIVILVASTPISRPKLMHLAEARLFTKFLSGASLLMSFHLGGHCRQGYDVTRSSFLAGCTRRLLPGILAYHYHTHHPAAWTKISEYISNGPLVLSAHSWPTVLVSVEFNKKVVAPSTIISVTNNMQCGRYHTILNSGPWPIKITKNSEVKRIQKNTRTHAAYAKKNIKIIIHMKNH